MITHDKVEAALVSWLATTMTLSPTVDLFAGSLPDVEECVGIVVPPLSSYAGDQGIAKITFMAQVMMRGLSRPEILEKISILTCNLPIFGISIDLADISVYFNMIDIAAGAAPARAEFDGRTVWVAVVPIIVTMQTD